MKSFFSGDVIGESLPGGLAGYNYGIIIDSYNTGNVTGKNLEAGGLAGVNDGTGAVITNSYAACIVIATIVGGLVSKNKNGASETNSFFDSQVAGTANSAIGTPLNTTEIKSISTYDGIWDFPEIWQLDPLINNGYPYLLGNPPE